MNSVSRVKSFRLKSWEDFSIRMFNLTDSNCVYHQTYSLQVSVFTMILGVGKVEQLSLLYTVSLKLKVPTGFQPFCSTTQILNTKNAFHIMIYV